MTGRRELKVGAFVLAGLTVMGIVVFLIGDSRRLFDSKVVYQLVFEDVQGLSRGAPVRMGGVDIGRVSGVSYAEDPSDVRLHVTIHVVKSEAVRIRKDSVGTIANRGLLGDKMVVIEPGSPGAEPLFPGETIPSESPQDFSVMYDRLAAISAKAETVMSNLEKTTGTFADEDVQEDLKVTVRSLSRILKSVDEGDGYVSRLLHDSEEADKLSRTMTHLERSAMKLDRTLDGAQAAVERVRTGPGFAHDVIYGTGPSETIDEFGRAAGEIATTLQGVREGNGLARSLIYGDDQSQKMMGNLDAIATDVRGILADVRAGKGTLGALLVDPSVYEDLKLLLGNVERNRVLRALVRYSIQRDEAAPARIAEPAPARGSAGAAVGRSE